MNGIKVHVRLVVLEAGATFRDRLTLSTGSISDHVGRDRAGRRQRSNLCQWIRDTSTTRITTVGTKRVSCSLHASREFKVDLEAQPVAEGTNIRRDAKV